VARVPTEVTLDMDELVSRSGDRQAGISWPLPVDAKLERLLQMARDVGEPTSRREIAACLVAFAEVADADALSEMLFRYRRMRVRELVSAPDNTNIVAFTQHGPGPRRRRA
jgi:hypothetical protein